MYKGASRNMQHALGVDRVHPSGGYIDTSEDKPDVLAGVSTMTIEQLQSEQIALRGEVLQYEQRIAVAKAGNDAKSLRILGATKQTISQRLSAVNKRLKLMDDARDARLLQALRELYGQYAVDRVKERARQIKEEQPQ